MNEYEFKIKITKDNNQITALNEDAIELKKEFNEKYPEFPLMSFILMCPNSMDMIDGGELIYSVEKSYKEEVLREMAIKYNDLV